MKNDTVERQALSEICDLTFMCAVNGDDVRPLMPSRAEIVKVYELARLAFEGKRPVQEAGK